VNQAAAERVLECAMNDVAFSMDQNWLDGLKLRVFTSDFPMFSALGRCLRPQTMELQA
jgi:hypothetical protein